MKKKIALLFCTSIICLPLHLTLLAEPPPAKGKKGGKEEVEAPKKDTPKKETPKKDLAKKETDKETAKEATKEPRTILKDFIDRTPYTRELAKTIPSPFKNLIVAEKLRVKAEKEAAIKKAEAEAAAAASSDSGTAPIKLPENQTEKEFILIQDARKQMEVVMQLVEIKKYELAESKLDLMDNTLAKNNVEKYRDVIAKKKLEVIAEHKDWDEINKIMASLSVDAMFVAEGKKKVALINDIAVEEGDDLNEMLSLAKDSPIILTFVSSNSLKIKYKKFTLQKELIDDDL